ncbi:MAG: hypothetical protein QOG33_150 [Gaiellales bacterium]|jgi:hypothetical protein|nr:hypothetical protein [Gaiellales bacterium]
MAKPGTVLGALEPRAAATLAVGRIVETTRLHGDHLATDICRAPCPSLANPELAVRSRLLSTATDIVTPLTDIQIP